MLIELSFAFKITGLFIKFPEINCNETDVDDDKNEYPAKLPDPLLLYPLVNFTIPELSENCIEEDPVFDLLLISKTFPFLLDDTIFKLELFDTFKLPEISKEELGFDVPIPTLPEV
jgi:hypothetical protein